jgi:uncharacterized membrane protein
MEPGLRAGIVILCLVGLYVSFFMLRKYIRAQRGQLDEPSVVSSPRAKIARVPNAMIGLVYYAFMLLLTPFLSHNDPVVVDAALIAALAATVSSLYLAYSLLFVTRMPCRYCWTGHVINWSLLGLVIAIARSG